MSENDEYIIAAPTKLGIDWSPKKIQDLVEDIRVNIKINDNRIYLTGLSMGGRGTFIVASKLPNLFAAIMPLSPHHRPCLLYTSPSPRDRTRSRMPSSA